jgi:serine/threonine-protein kinase
MATVFCAFDRQLCRPVAVKVLHPELTHLLGPERFRREVSIAAALQHPNIVPVYESGSQGDLLYYTMPLVEGETLRARLVRETQLPLDEALRIAEDVAEALRCAHEHGIVHRDIKPENILLSGGHAVVADFGIARAITVAGEDRLTSAGMAVGTPAYMSPEQAGAAANVDGRADIYALGCVLYEMLGGEAPFTGPSAQVVLARQMEEAPRSLHVVRKTVSPALQRVIETALAKVPADRYSTAGAFVSALEHSKRAPGWHTRRRWRMALGGTAMAAAAGAAWLLRPGSPTLDPLKVVVFPLAESNGGGASGAGEDLAQVISSAMEQAEPLRVVFGWTWLTPAQRRDVRLLTEREARNIARAHGARFFVDGSLVRLGDSARVALRLHDAGADSLLDQRSELGLAGAAVLPHLALSAVARLLPRLLPTERGFDLSVIQHLGPVAMSDWLLGERFYRRSRFDSALVFYQRAVALDSGFTYAAFKGAQAANWLHRDSLALVLIELARRPGRPLPAQYREFSDGFRFYVAGAADSAAIHLRRAVSGDTAWAGAWMALGEVYYHLLPADADEGETARAAFERAHRLDPEFSPALVHLTEISIRQGDLARADSFLQAFRGAHPDSANLTTLALMLACPRRGPRAVDWDAAARAHAKELEQAAKSLSAGLTQAACAEPALRALLRLPPADSLGGIRWGAVLALQALLVGEGRNAEARVLLREEYARGLQGVLRIYLVDAGLGVGTDSEAAVVSAAIAATGPLLSRQTSVLWDLGPWVWRRGDGARLDSIVTILRARLPLGVPMDSVVYASMAGHAALLRGDTTAAIAHLRSVRAVGPQQELAWDLGLPAAEERLLLARLLLARREYGEAARVAAVLGHPQPVAFVSLIRASLEIRAAAARETGQTRAAAGFEARLADIARAAEQGARKP